MPGSLAVSILTVYDEPDQIQRGSQYDIETSSLSDIYILVTEGADGNSCLPPIQRGLSPIAHYLCKDPDRQNTRER